MAKTIKNLDKKKAWDNFSRFIRTRDCLAATGIPFVGHCITCGYGRRFHIRYLQAGHCLPGRSNTKLFDERLVHAQCKHCNEYRDGRIQKYEKLMITKYGAEEFEQMKIASRNIIQDKDMDFKEIAKTYKEKYEKLLREHGYKTWGELLRQGE